MRAARPSVPARAAWPGGPRGERLPVRLLILAALAVLIAARLPHALHGGRFWAEEGRWFFERAATLPPWRALWTGFGGYLDLAASGGTLLARLVPLPWAAFVTMAIGLAFQLATPAILLGARDAWLRPLAVRVLACLLVVLVPASEEVWLQTLHVQFHLALAAAVTAALAPPPRQGRRLALLGFAPLCGPAPIAVAPVFLVQVLRAPAGSARRARLAQLAALGTGAALQLACFYEPWLGRNWAVRPEAFLRLFAVKHVVLPFLGVERTGALAARMVAAGAAGHPAEWPLGLLALAAALFVAAAIRARASVALVLAGSACLLAGVGTYGAIGDPASLLAPGLGQRYEYVPQALLALAVLALAAAGRGVVRGGATVAVAGLLAVGARDYRHTSPFVSDGPSWRSEATRWMRDPSHPLALWPRGWSVTLPAPGAGTAPR